MADEIVKSDQQNALADIAVIGGVQKYDDSAFEVVSKAADYLCRLQLCGSNSNLFKLNKIAKQNYAYVVSKDDFKDLGPSVDILVICWRPKALDMSGDTPVSFYDVNTPEFKEIQEKSGQMNSNCTYGPEYLVWIPQIKKFATLHWGSKTARKDAKFIHALLYQPATLTSRVVGPNDKQQVWETMVISACTTPFDMPTKEETQAVVDKFNNEATAKGPEKADTNTRAR